MSKITIHDIAREFSQYFHSLDVWHKSKKLKKCLAEVSVIILIIIWFKLILLCIII